MRFHVVALPHTKTTKEYCACAYTQKVRNFCKMMRSLGHEVFHYGAEGSEVEAEHVTVITDEEQQVFFGACNWKKQGFSARFDPEEPYWRLMNQRAVQEIRKRAQQRDFLCLIGGDCQKPIADTLPHLMAVEFGVGYHGVFAPFKVFESYTHQACVYGHRNMDPDVNLYDVVIPNFFDPADFPLCEKKSDYLLFVGRINRRKGVQIAIDTARATGRQLVVAGQQGDFELPSDVKYVGYADVRLRAKLMGEAHALLAPTTYLEPFGGVAVEAQLCGTPAITTDAGGFAETVIQWGSGFRCRTLAQFVRAVNQTYLLSSPHDIRQSTLLRHSTGVVRYFYEEYFESLMALWGAGWYALANAA